MGFFSSGPSLKEVDRYSIETIDRFIGSGLQVRHVDRKQFDRLLDELAKYSEHHNLGMMKKAAIMGKLELFLSQAVSAPERHEFMKAVRSRFA